MANLTISYTEILDALGRAVGWGPTYSAWSSNTTQVADAAKFINSGLRRFYFHTQADGSPHQWSFLTPVSTLTTANGTQAYKLPTDFVSIKTGFVMAGGTEAVRLVKRTNAQILELIRNEDKSGVPEYYSVRSTGDSGQVPAYEVVFYPKPDAAYELKYRYLLSPPQLDTNNVYHLGGAQHSETVLEAILASAEKLLNDNEDVHDKQFRELLVSSIAIDKELSDDEDEDDVWEATTSSLEIDVNYLRRVVGRFLGFGPQPGIWSRKQVEEVKLAIQSGLRRFYHPAPVVEDRPRHIWSFLTPTERTTIAASQTELPLPADFMDLASEVVSFVNSANRSAVRVGQDTIRKMRDNSGRTEAPRYVAVRSRSRDEDATSHELMLYPTPDQEYTIEYRYLMAPPVVTDEHPLPLGGALHAETIIESCLASAESIMGTANGPHEAKFRELLANSILMDVQLADPNEAEVWPFENDADSLSVNKAYLKRMIGRSLNFSPHAGLWTHAQLKQVEATLQIGLRKFYSPPILPQEKYSHEWSFLKPLAQIDCVSGQHTYDLPEDFAIIHGPLTFAPDTTTLYPPVEIVGEEYLRYRRQHTAASARPSVAAVAPKAAGPDGQTRYELSLYPTPDSTYSLHYRYMINPDLLADEVTLPIGGQMHAQTVLEASLSAAEEMRGVGEGLHTRRFLECLRASVGHDRKVMAPDTLGYNGDGYPLYRMGSWHEHDENVVTYGGYNPDS